MRMRHTGSLQAVGHARPFQRVGHRFYPNLRDTGVVQRAQSGKQLLGRPRRVSGHCAQNQLCFACTRPTLVKRGLAASQSRACAHKDADSTRRRTPLSGAGLQGALQCGRI